MKTTTAKSTKQTQPPAKARRGFACITPARRTEIARLGGKTVSRNRAHMAEIGAIGGSNTQANWKARVKAASKR